MKHTHISALLAALLLPVALAHDTVSHGRVKAEFHTDALGSGREGLRTGDDTLVGVTLKVSDRPLAPDACRCQLLLYPGQPSARVRPEVISLSPRGAGLEGWVKVSAPGAYTLVLAGKPTAPGAFDAFRLEFPVMAGQP
ncbi:hypothetical protein ACFP81_02185 [Deinococcus lacus]|uniref:DUF2141 domain-containing protein n=1 Tax=Deinococcus lacus TaxID=392561 RepID=A0ABW1Y9H4_9DEIO